MKVKFSAVALRWVSDEPQPGLIEVSIHDAFGKEHRIIEKSMVIAPIDIWEDAPFPVAFVIEAEPNLVNDKEVLVTLPWYMEATDGTTQLVLSRANVEEL